MAAKKAALEAESELMGITRADDIGGERDCFIKLWATFYSSSIESEYIGSLEELSLQYTDALTTSGHQPVASVSEASPVIGFVDTGQIDWRLTTALVNPQDAERTLTENPRIDSHSPQREAKADLLTA